MAGRAQQRMSTGGPVAELTTAITEADLALALLDLRDLTVLAVSRSWLNNLGLPPGSVIGHAVTDLVRSDQRAAATTALQSLSQGVVSIYMAHRALRSAPGAAPMTTQWLRGFDVGDRRLALVQAAPASDDALSPIAKHFGREPTTMAIGTIDRDFVITALSSDITALLGFGPQKLIGKVLIEAVAHRDVAPLLTAGDQLADQAVGLIIHMQNSRRQWVALCCVLVSLAGCPDLSFILSPEPDHDGDRSRVAELEQHLWHIAAVIEASGVLQRVGPMRDMRALPQVNSLTTRQWEILARIVRGERVPTIAADLHLSQSTIRSHLSVIFKRFGVRSQPELLRAIEAGTDATSA